MLLVSITMINKGDDRMMIGLAIFFVAMVIVAWMFAPNEDDGTSSVSYHCCK